jgi:capsular exopolysaccharide synthesis family protein
MMFSNEAGIAPVDDGAPEKSSLRGYLDVIKERWLFILLAVVLCTFAAAAYVFTADKVYEAHADMLVMPVPADQTPVLGLGLIRQASDPTRDVTTAARLIANLEVARRAARELRTSTSPQALLRQVSVQPVAQSSIVAITASGGTPADAQRLANAFGAATVAERTEQLHRELDPAIEAMRARIAAVSGSESAEVEALNDQLATLELLRSGSDPTIRVETPAAAPATPVSPRTKLSLIGGVFAGLLLGIAGAFALKALDMRGEREAHLRRMGLGVLAHVPDASRSRGSRQTFEEAFRILRTMLRFASPREPYRTIAVTSASEQEGKTTTASQLAFAVLEAGQTVLLVEVDAYRPALHRLLDVVEGANGDSEQAGLLDYLSGRATLDEVVRSTAVPGLSFVAAGSLGMDSMSGILEQPQGRAFVREFAQLADLVILDCPPIGPRADAILIAAVADGVLLVVDGKQSSDREVTHAIQRLRSAQAEVIGVVLNRDEQTSEYHYGAAPKSGVRSRFALLGPERRARHRSRQAKGSAESD